MRATGFSPGAAGGSTGGTGGGRIRAGGTAAGGPAGTGGAGGSGPGARRACATPGGGRGGDARIGSPTWLCRRPRCPGWASPAQTAVPGVGLGGIPGLPGVGVPGDISGYDVPGLMNQAYALVNGVVGANAAASSVGPAIGGAVGAVGIVVGAGTSVLNALTTLAVFKPNQWFFRRRRHQEPPKLVSMLVPTVSAAQLPSVNVQALAADLRALPPLPPASLPAVALPRSRVFPRWWKASRPCRHLNCRRYRRRRNCRRRPSCRLPRCCAVRRSLFFRPCI